jgi:Fe-S-cluster containining protein
MEDDEPLIVKGIRIDPSVLRQESIQRCALAECQAACCTGGVWLTADEMPRILASAEIVKPFLPPDRREPVTWFSAGEPDENMPRGYEMGTTTVDDPQRPGQTCCVFLRHDRKCALQVASTAHDLGWPGLKPFFCASYPMYLENGVLSMDDDTPLDFEGAGCRRPAAAPRPMYEVYREEAILILGEDGYQELCERVRRS